LENFYGRMPYLFEQQKTIVYWSLRNVVYTAWINCSCEENFDEKCIVFSKGMTCREMLGGFGELCQWLCLFMNQARKDKTQELKKKVLEYLEENYSDPALSIYGVSCRMGMSERYLSEFFREKLGESFPSLVAGIRIRKAKEYLEKTDYSNEKIAELVGFGTTNSFYRCFKERTGITPRKFKEERSI